MKYEYTLEEEYTSATSSYSILCDRKLTKEEVVNVFANADDSKQATHILEDNTKVLVSFNGYEFGHSENDIYGEFAEEEE